MKTLLEKLTINNWEREILKEGLNFSLKLAQAFLTLLDEELAKKRNPQWKLIGKRKRTLFTLFGPLKVERRLFKDEQGRFRFLLDEKLGWKKGKCATSDFLTLVAQLSTGLPYRQVEEVLSLYVSSPSHATIQKMVTSLGEERTREEKEKRERLYLNGELPEKRGKRSPEVLLMEADGVSISLQREKEKKTEIKLVYSHEGWEKEGKGRYSLKGKKIYSGLAPSSTFWQDFSLLLDEHYSLSGVKYFVISGDGAPWVKEGAEYFSPSIYQLDRFHLKRAITKVLRGKGAQEVYSLLISHDLQGALNHLQKMQEEASKERKKEIEELTKYILSNSSGLSDYREKLPRELQGNLRPLGAAEGNIDKILANRFKKRGMSWSKRGANSLAKVIALRENGELDDCISQKSRAESIPSSITKRVKERLRKEVRKSGKDIGTCMPALYGPHSGRPWVQVLREITSLKIDPNLH